MSEVNKTIFKAYDIRGTYPDQLNEEAAYLIGRAFARKAQAKEVAVGLDVRLSGPVLKRALIRGITDEGTNIVDIGMVPIDAVYFMVGILGEEAGIMVTASHNPKDYNGFKMVLKDMNWIRGVELLEDVLNLPELENKEKGKVREEDIIDRYLKHVLGFAEIKKIKRLKVVVDAGNGVAGKIMPLLAKELPIEMIPLNFKLDGSFPAHPSNPLLPESQKEITERVVKEKADFGVIMDGDTDRLFFVDEKGNFIRADITLLVLAKYFLEKEPGAGIAYNVICSRVVPEKIKEWGGRPLRSAVGFVNVSVAMREGKGIMGGELSAHYSFRDNAYADSGFIAFLILLQLLSEEKEPLSQIVAPFYKYEKTHEINIEVPDVKLILEKVKTEYKDFEQDYLDGVSVLAKEWWFNVRPSNTEPLLRITVEGETKEIMERERDKLVGFIKANI